MDDEFPTRTHKYLGHSSSALLVVGIVSELLYWKTLGTFFLIAGFGTRALFAAANLGYMLLSRRGHGRISGHINAKHYPFSFKLHLILHGAFFLFWGICFVLIL